MKNARRVVNTGGYYTPLGNAEVLAPRSVGPTRLSHTPRSADAARFPPACALFLPFQHRGVQTRLCRAGRAGERRGAPGTAVPAQAPGVRSDPGLRHLRFLPLRRKPPEAPAPSFVGVSSVLSADPATPNFQARGCSNQGNGPCDPGGPACPERAIFLEGFIRRPRQNLVVHHGIMGPSLG